MTTTTTVRAAARTAVVGALITAATLVAAPTASAATAAAPATAAAAPATAAPTTYRWWARGGPAATAPSTGVPRPPAAAAGQSTGYLRWSGGVQGQEQPATTATTNPATAAPAAGTTPTTTPTEVPAAAAPAAVEAATPAATEATPAAPAAAVTPEPAPVEPAPAPVEPAPAPAPAATVVDVAIVNTAGDVQPVTQAAVNAVVAAVPTVTSVGGTRASATDPAGHPAGLAADFMVADAATGDAVLAYLKAHWDELGVDYAIWQQTYYPSADSPGEPMASRGSATADHEDHVHAKFTG